MKKIRTWKDWQGDLNFAFWQKLGDFIETKAKKSSALPGLVSPVIDASYHVSVHLAKLFQSRRFLEIDQSETRIACGGHFC